MKRRISSPYFISPSKRQHITSPSSAPRTQGKMFKNFMAACKHYKFPGSHQVGSYGPKGKGVIRTYSNSTPGKDIVLEQGNIFLYRLKPELKKQFQNNIILNKPVHVFTKMGTGVLDRGNYLVEEILRAGKEHQPSVFGKEFVKFVRVKEKGVKKCRKDYTTNSLDPIYNKKSKPHTLVLGTHPSKQSLAITNKSGEALEKFIQKRGGSGPQNYGNPSNSFWNIAGSYLGFRRDMITYEEQKEKWAEAGLVLWDVIRSCSYKDNSSLDSKINMDTVVPNAIDELLDNTPSITKIVFAKTSALMFKREECFMHLLKKNKSSGSSSSTPSPSSFPLLPDRKWEFVVRTDGDAIVKKGTLDVFGKSSLVRQLSTEEILSFVTSTEKKRLVELIVLPSTSPANAAMKNASKEKLWHIACYGCNEDQPSSTYVCANCQEQGNHWLIDCPNDGYSKWCIKRKQKYKSSKEDPDNGGDRWLFSNPVNPKKNK
jgi:hypoxanthine-DNA glycosylase